MPKSKQSQFIRNLRDMGSIELVSVITSFDTEGHIRPLYIRIGEDCLKVHSSWERHFFNDRRVFQCKVIDNNCLKPLVITFYEHEATWAIDKTAIL